VDFTGRSVIVTGAASGAGKATALAFGKAGASVALLDVDEAGAQAVADQMDGDGHRAAVWRVDLAAAADVTAAVRDVNERFGRLDAVANVAGIYPRATVPDITEEFWDNIHAIDLRGVFFCCQEAMRIMAAQGGGAIVNVSSAAAFFGLAGHAAYSAAKAGLVGLSRVLAIEGASSGVRVNVIAPGLISGGAPVEQMTDELQREGYAKATAVARPVTPEEIANSILWLCSDASSGVSGAILPVANANYMSVG
jgi:NAD(P)-dependent dehydrogenase (short-subunit alcohol dehydrogenase family)